VSVFALQVPVGTVGSGTTHSGVQQNGGLDVYISLPALIVHLHHQRASIVAVSAEVQILRVVQGVSSVLFERIVGLLRAASM